MKSSIKTIIFDSFGTWKCTSDSNYKASVMDTRLVYDLGSDLEQAVEIVQRNFGDDYIVIGKEDKVC